MPQSPARASPLTSQNRMGGDIPISPRRGLALLPVVKDLCKKQIVGSPSPTHDTNLTRARMASGAATARLIFHSDRGVNTPLACQVSPASASASMSQGHPYDNAVENFFSCLKWVRPSAISPQGTCRQTSSLISRPLQPSAPAFLYWLASSGCLLPCLSIRRLSVIERYPAFLSVFFIFTSTKPGRAQSEGLQCHLCHMSYQCTMTLLLIPLRKKYIPNNKAHSFLRHLHQSLSEA